MGWPGHTVIINPDRRRRLMARGGIFIPPKMGVNLLCLVKTLISLPVCVAKIVLKGIRGGNLVALIPMILYSWLEPNCSISDISISSISLLLRKLSVGVL